MLQYRINIGISLSAQVPSSCSKFKSASFWNKKSLQLHFGIFRPHSFGSDLLHSGESKG